MYNIKLLNKISEAGLTSFDKNKYSWSEDMANADAIMVRSASMHDMEIDPSVKAVARAGAGVNNIPCDKYAEQGIVVFNTPGANANAVKELVLLGLLISSRKVAPALEWVRGLKGQGAEVGKLVEKGKSQFAGPEIYGKTLGVIGLGAIGILVANAARALGMTVYGYDPYLSVNAAWDLSRSIKHATDLKEIYANCDYITVHVPFNASTKDMINAEVIASMKDGVRILNFARGELVNADDILAALESKKVSAYVTDFPTDAQLCADGVIALPHLGASTPESEDNCARMAALELQDFLENGNIKNSVNFANVSMPRAGTNRICVFHKNIKSVLSQISTAISDQGVNIENMVNAAKNDFSYTIVDVASALNDEVIAKIDAIEGVIKVRVI